MLNNNSERWGYRLLYLYNLLHNILSQKLTRSLIDKGIKMASKKSDFFLNYNGFSEKLRYTKILLDLSIRFVPIVQNVGSYSCQIIYTVSCPYKRFTRVFKKE